MSSIADLESEKEWYYEKISEAKAQIKKLENNHDSLSLFKNDATKSSESFYSINSKKNSYLSDIEELKKNSRMSKRYYKGMKGVLDGTGAKIVLVAYSVLLKNVKSKLDDYIKKINKLEDDISRYYERIAAINAEITSLKAAEKTNWTTQQA